MSYFLNLINRLPDNHLWYNENTRDAYIQWMHTILEDDLGTIEGVSKYLDKAETLAGRLLLGNLVTKHAYWQFVIKEIFDYIGEPY
jgi:hypothetical protein